MSCFPLLGAVHFNLSIVLLCLVFVSNLAANTEGESRKDASVAVLASAELPAKSVDLAALNLTELVNGMLQTALKGTKTFFSLLSITSYSSYAFHKVSIVVYNISNLKNIDPAKFPMRYCYCLNNRTNDLTDFTALLVDIIGNSTSYLKEIFKSTSILSVSQSNETDCVHICVMSGRTGRNLSDLWEAVDKPPVISYTFSGNVSDVLDADSILSNLIPIQDDAGKVLGDAAAEAWTFKTPKASTDTPRAAAVQGGETVSLQSTTRQKTVSLKSSDASSSQTASWLQTDALKEGDVSPTRMAPTPAPLTSSALPSAMRWAFTTGIPLPLASRSTQGQDELKNPLLLRNLSSFVLATPPQKPNKYLKVHPTSRNNHVEIIGMCKSDGRGSLKYTKYIGKLGCRLCALKRETLVTSPAVTVLVRKINPCVMELCMFFQQCLCIKQRRYSREDIMRYCIENYSWFLRNAPYVCEKVKRMAHSNTLKQQCLASICRSI